jgi:hypothetical protein
MASSMTRGKDGKNRPRILKNLPEGDLPEIADGSRTGANC